MRQVDLAAIRQQCNTRDEMVGIETARLRELLDALEQAEVLLQQACSVCACGCPESEHENYGEDGEACEHEQHQCVRTSRSVRTMLGQAEQQNTELRAELAGRLSDAFRSIPTRYDTPADHYREMARRVVADRDALKHAKRKAEERVAALEVRNQALVEALIRYGEHDPGCEAADGSHLCHCGFAEATRG